MSVFVPNFGRECNYLHFVKKFDGLKMYRNGSSEQSQLHLIFLVLFGFVV